MMNFRLIRTERVCRRQFEIWCKLAERILNGLKTLWEKGKRGKGEIACYEQFLLFQQCFQKTCTADS